MPLGHTLTVVSRASGGKPAELTVFHARTPLWRHTASGMIPTCTVCTGSTLPPRPGFVSAYLSCLGVGLDWWLQACSRQPTGLHRHP
jgi:hypothetical protein